MMAEYPEGQLLIACEDGLRQKIRYEGQLKKEKKSEGRTSESQQDGN